jgi:hypothetical protein
VLGTWVNAKALHAISRALVKHFTSLEKITFRITNGGRGMFMEPEPKLSEKQTITELSRMLETLLDRHSLKEIRIATKDSINMEAAVMKILPKRPETSKIWKVEVEEEE